MTIFRYPETVDPRAVIGFWRAAGPGRWFSKSDQFDAEVGRRLGSRHYWAAAGMLDVLKARETLVSFSTSPEGKRALSICSRSTS